MSNPLIALRIPPALLSKLQAMAKKEDRPISYIVRRAIEHSLKLRKQR